MDSIIFGEVLLSGGKRGNNLSGVIVPQCTKIVVIRRWSGPCMSACSRRIRTLRFRGDAAGCGSDAVRCAAGFRHRHTDPLLYEPTKHNEVGLSRRRSNTRHGFIGDILRAGASCFSRFPDPEYKKIATGWSAKKATRQLIIRRKLCTRVRQEFFAYWTSNVC